MGITRRAVAISACSSVVGLVGCVGQKVEEGNRLGEITVINAFDGNIDITVVVIDNEEVVHLSSHSLEPASKDGTTIRGNKITPTWSNSEGEYRIYSSIEEDSVHELDMYELPAGCYKCRILIDKEKRVNMLYSNGCDGG